MAGGKRARWHSNGLIGERKRLTVENTVSLLSLPCSPIGKSRNRHPIIYLAPKNQQLQHCPVFTRRRQRNKMAAAALAMRKWRKTGSQSTLLRETASPKSSFHGSIRHWRRSNYTWGWQCCQVQAADPRKQRTCSPHRDFCENKRGAAAARPSRFPERGEGALAATRLVRRIPATGAPRSDCDRAREIALPRYEKVPRCRVLLRRERVSELSPSLSHRDTWRFDDLARTCTPLRNAIRATEFYVHSLGAPVRARLAARSLLPGENCGRGLNPHRDRLPHRSYEQWKFTYRPASAGA